MAGRFELLKFEVRLAIADFIVCIAILWRMTFGWKAADIIFCGIIKDVLVTVSDCRVACTGRTAAEVTDVEVTVAEATAVKVEVVLCQGVAFPVVAAGCCIFF